LATGLSRLTLRIAFIAWRDLSHPQAGGSEYVIDELAKGMVGRGHEVVLLAGSPTTSHIYETLPIGGTYGQYLRAPFVFHRKVRHADVIVDVENGIPFFAPLWTRTPTVCLVHHVHTQQWSMQFPAPIAAVGRILESRVMPRVYRGSTYVSVSPSTSRSLRELGINDADITTIEMGSPPVVATRPRSVEPRFLILGRLVPHKRVELALRIWPAVHEATGGTLVIAGDGPESGMLRTLATEGVKFAGHITEEQKSRELSEAWILIHPAHHEGWGTVVMEAAGVGLPTVGFDVEGIRDSVADGVTGLLANDESAFAAAWIRLATNTAERNRMAAAAIERSKSFTWPRALDLFEQVMRKRMG